MKAIPKILHHLPANLPVPIIIVQHLHPQNDLFYVKYLNEDCKLNVKEAGDKEDILAGNVYFAPANYHLLVEEDKTFSLSVDQKVRYSRPSIDVLFESVVEVYKSELAGIVLTGANEDGASGMKKIKSVGGITIVQDPKTADVPMMPQEAMNAVAVDYILPIDEIASLLNSFCITL